MMTQQGKHIKTDKRDDHKLDLKKTKQRINAFCLSQGFHYDKGKWTQAHLKWLKSLELGGLDRETLNEYLQTAVARELACSIWGMMTDNISMA